MVSILFNRNQQVSIMDPRLKEYVEKRQEIRAIQYREGEPLPPDCYVHEVTGRVMLKGRWDTEMVRDGDYIVYEEEGPYHMDEVRFARKWVEKE